MNAKPKAGLFPYWILVETGGIAILLSLIVILPVKVSEHFARKTANLNREGRLDYYESSHSRRREFLELVQDQLSALQRGDYQKARSLTTQKYRNAVPLLEFERLIQKGYPIMLEPVTAELLDAVDNGETAFARILLRTNSENFFVFDYIMRVQSDIWRIFAVKQLAVGPHLDPPDNQSEAQNAKEE